MLALAARNGRPIAAVELAEHLLMSEPESEPQDQDAHPPGTAAMPGLDRDKARKVMREIRALQKRSKLKQPVLSPQQVARELLQRAADRDCPEALVFLAEHDDPRLVEGPAQAEALLRRAVDLGSVEALYVLGVRRDDAESLERAAAKGHALAHYYLAHLKKNGCVLGRGPRAPPG
jgi:TPR repeat protein